MAKSREELEAQLARALGQENRRLRERLGDDLLDGLVEIVEAFGIDAVMPGKGGGPASLSEAERRDLALIVEALCDKRAALERDLPAIRASRGPYAYETTKKRAEEQLRDLPDLIKRIQHRLGDE